MKSGIINTSEIPEIEKKNSTNSANYQPSLFENSVVEHTAFDKSIVPHSTRRRKRIRLRRITMEQIDRRQAKGQFIAKHSEITLKAGHHLVPSQSSSTVYKVDSTNYTCTCPDYTFNKQKCKHIYAVEFRQNRREWADVTEMPEAPKYTQNWRTYNKSQVTEKARFLSMLSDLTREIDDPEQTNGRPTLPLGDMLFSVIFKVYSQMSTRRFTTDLQFAHAQGLITECPHYNSVIRAMASPAITELLESLVEVTSKPLAALESNFAVDSTGMSISNAVSWHRAKHQDPAMLKRKNWLKIHCCVGTHTNVITAVEVTDKRSHDHLHFIPVVEATRKNFNIKEVSADKAYSSAAHAKYTEMHGIDSFIPFKENTNASSPQSSGVFARMFHYFSLNRAEFVQRYNMRSNVETTFHMVKSKFGGLLKSKTFEAQKNEALCKVVCHNICCLIQTIDEFGIEI